MKESEFVEKYKEIIKNILKDVENLDCETKQSLLYQIEIDKELKINIDIREPKRGAICI